MKSVTHHSLPTAVLAAAEARLGLRLAAGLTARTEHTPHDIAERLRVAREQALARAREARVLVHQAGVVQVAQGPAATLAGPPPWWLRLASVLPLLVLALGLVLIQQASVQEEISAAAEVDAALLADDLPPDAYSDPGFHEFLKTPPSL